MNKSYKLKLNGKKKYDIILRNVNSNNNELNERINIIKTKGFINYCDIKYFGDNNIGMYEIGRAILKKDFLL